LAKSDGQNRVYSELRLNQAIAKSGLCSRRKANDLVLAGRVTVNGQPAASFSLLVNPAKDTIKVDGRIITGHGFVYVLLHKPKGIITTCSDEKGRPSVLDLLPTSLRHLKPAGRLDRDSAGLLLLTNDGSLIQALTRPTRHVPKTYRVTIAGMPSEKALESLAAGVKLSDGMTQPAKIRLVSNKSGNACFEIVIYEGKNRQIRRMCGSLGLTVLNLLRVAIGELQLSGLKSGTWRQLSGPEISRLRHHLMPGSG
jgi:23S rRNA pseudouridine2605 synthase